MVVSHVAKAPARASLLSWVAVFIASTGTSGFWLGWLTGKRGFGGGTVSSAVTLAFQLVLYRIGTPWWVMLAIAVLSFPVGLVAIGPAERLLFERYGPRKRHTGAMTDHDFNETTWDEFHGQMIAGLCAWAWPHANVAVPTLMLILSFGLFRLFDGAKPGLVGWAERRYDGNAFGVMIDDTVAGIHAFLILFLTYAMIQFSL